MLYNTMNWINNIFYSQLRQPSISYVFIARQHTLHGTSSYFYGKQVKQLHHSSCISVLLYDCKRLSEFYEDVKGAYPTIAVSHSLATSQLQQFTHCRATLLYIKYTDIPAQSCRRLTGDRSPAAAAETSLHACQS